MDQELKAKWVAALRSGEYVQTTMALWREFEGCESNCCLGVLARLGGGEKADVRTNRFIKDKAFDIKLPNGIKLSAFKASGFEPFGLSDEQAGDLASRNDNGASFPEIADYIEKNL